MYAHTHVTAIDYIKVGGLLTLAPNYTCMLITHTNLVREVILLALAVELNAYGWCDIHVCTSYMHVQVY